MRRLLLTLCILADILSAQAQVSNVSYSPGFEEPGQVDLRLLQLPNGNTFFFKFTDKEIEYTLYDKDRGIIGRKSIDNEVLNKKTIKHMSIEGLYEIGGEAVFFVQIVEKRIPQMYRIRFDKNNGSIVEQKKIGELMQYKRSTGFAVNFGGVASTDFTIVKDPNSDAYAQVNYNAYADETNKRIEVIHYQVNDGRHEVVNSAFYEIEEYKYVKEIGMCVNNDDIFMTTYASNPSASGDEDTRIWVSRLSKGNSQFRNKEIEFTEDFKKTTGKMLFNKKSNMLQLMTTTLTESKNSTRYYLVLVSYIDPESLQIAKTMIPPVESLTDAKQKVKGPKTSYTGLPQKMVLLDDNNTALVMHEEMNEVISPSSSTVLYTTYKDIGVVVLDGTGKEVASYCYIKPTENTGGYSTYDVVNANDKMYIFHNEKPENMTIQNPAAREALSSFSWSVAIYAKLEKGVIERDYLLEPTKGDTYTTFAYFSSGHFDKNTNTYAVMMVRRDGRKKTAHIAWITFE